MPITDAPPYRHWPGHDRPPLSYPGGKRMACYIAVNIEHFEIGAPATSRTALTAGLPVDPFNHGWRDYGVRVGFWRMLDAIDRAGLPVSALVNSEAAVRYPELISAGRERGWAFLGHGRTNSRLWTGMQPDAERRALADIVATLERATGARPRGWLGPALTETAHTIDLLAAQGFTYAMDWSADDRPFPVDARGGRFCAVPYSVELNDIPVFIDQGHTPRAFGEMIVDQFEVLHTEAQTTPGAVFTVALHPFLVGQPFRLPYLRAALEAVSGHDDVWYATSDEIAQWYLDHAWSADVAAQGETA